MKEKSRHNAARKALIFWTLFIGTGAVGGSVMMLADPSGKLMGMDAMLPFFKVLPFADVLFNDFVFSGIALLIVNGLTNLTAAVLLFKKKKLGVILGGIFGVTLMLWICIQFYMFPLNFMSTIYFVFGFLQAATGYAALVFLKQETFCVNEEDYKNVGTGEDTLVVYFSRMGYVKKLAYETADRLCADIYEVKAVEKTDGTAGFWWCGRYGMHRWDMSINPPKIDFEKYKKAVICTPIWVFSLCAPMRSFCKAAAGKIKSADYIIVHHTGGKYLSAAKEMDEILAIKHDGFKSVRCRKGKFKEL